MVRSPRVDDSEISTVSGTTSGTIQVRRGVFESANAFREAYPRTVVVDCSDGRFTRCDEDFLHTMFQEPYADEIELPGGPALLNLMAASTVADVDVVRAKLQLLVRGHGTARIVLMMHEGCYHYRSKCPGLPAEEVAKRQLGDLVAVARDLRSRYPEIEIRAFYKRVFGESIMFDEVLVT